jgi:hypothetical protein
MRTSISKRHPRRGPFRVLAGVAVTFAVLGIGTAACGSQGELDPPSAISATPGQTAPPGVEGSTAAPMAESEPVSIQIPSLGVTSPIMDLGLRADGSMEVPPGAYPAGWYTGAPTPGELGPAIIAAHVDWNGDPGVFYELHELQPGDDVVVQRRDGSTALFQIDHVARYPKDQFPTEAVYGDIDHAGLRLITCGGDFDDSANSYVDNIVAYARLVDPTSN